MRLFEILLPAYVLAALLFVFSLIRLAGRPQKKRRILKGLAMHFISN